jgi:D-proline reductase (dithiol) PrdB
MKVDSFKYLPGVVARYYKMSRVKIELPIPWTPLARPLAQARFSLVTSGGLYHEGHEPPFDLEGERRQPDWGDPSYRTLPADVDPNQVRVSHLHLNAADIEADMNVLLPIQRFQELAAAGRIGSLAGRNYSFMGYQGFPADQQPWKEVYGPEVAGKLLADQVDCVLLTAA